MKLKRVEIPAGLIREIIDLSTGVYPFFNCKSIKFVDDYNSETNFQRFSYSKDNDLKYFFRFAIKDENLIITEIGRIDE